MMNMLQEARKEGQKREGLFLQQQDLWAGGQRAMRAGKDTYPMCNCIIYQMYDIYHYMDITNKGTIVQ